MLFVLILDLASSIMDVIKIVNVISEKDILSIIKVFEIMVVEVGRFVNIIYIGSINVVAIIMDHQVYICLRSNIINRTVGKITFSILLILVCLVYQIREIVL